MFLITKRKKDIRNPSFRLNPFFGVIEMIAVTCPSLQVYHASTTMELRKICASISGRPVVFVRVSFTPNVRVIALFRFCRTITDSQPYITSIDSLIAQVSSHDEPMRSAILLGCLLRSSRTIYPS